MNEKPSSSNFGEDGQGKAEVLQPVREVEAGEDVKSQSRIKMGFKGVVLAVMLANGAMAIFMETARPPNALGWFLAALCYWIIITSDECAS